MKRVAGQEFGRALERAGWTLDRINGSHHIYVKPGQRHSVSVPVHGNQTLPVGTQRSLMRQSGLTDDDL